MSRVLPHVHYQDWMEPLFLHHGVTTVRGESIQGTLTLVLPRPATVTYEQPDGTLDATYTRAGGRSRAQMTRVSE